MAYHRPPSRIRYEKEHPTITVRLSKDLKEYLTSISAATGKSYSALVKEGLENQILSKFIGKPITELSKGEITLLIKHLEGMVAELKKCQVKIW